MRIQYYTATSINGYIADENHSLNWLFQFGEIEGMAEHYSSFIKNVGAAVMGSSTYEWLLNHESMADRPKSWPYDFPVWVFSSRKLTKIINADIRFVSGDVRSFYSEILKSANGQNLWIVGGGDLARQFYDAGLLDELILTVAPVMLKSGAPLLAGSIITPALSLESVEKQSKDFVVLTYTVKK